jgi:hypothetical protein
MQVGGYIQRRPQELRVIVIVSIHPRLSSDIAKQV